MNNVATWKGKVGFLQEKNPLIFNGSVGTSIIQIASQVYDSMFLANDSANDVYFSVDGGNKFQTIRPAEIMTFDRFTRSLTFHVYAAAAASAVRCVLWRQDEQGNER